jgi:peptidoglycan hydrolase CwlO-like protein
MLWWLHDKAEKSGLQEEMLRVQLCSSHGEIHEKDGLILSLQHELDHNQALLQAETQRHKLELERAKAQEVAVEQEWSSRETELKAQVAALQMCADASQSQVGTYAAVKPPHLLCTVIIFFVAALCYLMH